MSLSSFSMYISPFCFFSCCMNSLGCGSSGYSDSINWQFAHLASSVRCCFSLSSSLTSNSALISFSMSWTILTNTESYILSVNSAYWPSFVYKSGNGCALQLSLDHINVPAHLYYSWCNTNAVSQGAILVPHKRAVLCAATLHTSIALFAARNCS